MSTSKENQRGSLIHGGLTDIFTQYFQNINGELTSDNLKVLVVSNEIITHNLKQTRHGNMYRSRYQNIEFVPELFPNASAMTILFDSTKTKFYEAYRDQLTSGLSRRCMIELCHIVDMIIRGRMNVVLISTDNDIYSVGFHEVLKDVFMEYFGMYMITYKEYQADPALLHQYGDDADIKDRLEHVINEIGACDDLTGTFINKYIDDAEEELRKLLEQKNKEELREYAARKKIYINKRMDKDDMIDRLIPSIMEKWY